MLAQRRTRTEKAVPTNPENNAKIRYNVPISLALQDKNHLSVHIEIFLMKYSLQTPIRNKKTNFKVSGSYSSCRNLAASITYYKTKKTPNRLVKYCSPPPLSSTVVCFLPSRSPSLAILSLVLLHNLWSRRLSMDA
jgi:hypothetical protein